MLSGLFDRLWTPTALYLILALPLYALRHVANNTIAYAALGAWTAYYAQNIVTAVLCERKIDALGGRAPSRRTWTPYNLGMLSDLIWYVSRHRVHEWWWKLFQRPGEESRYTVESIIMVRPGRTLEHRGRWSLMSFGCGVGCAHDLYCGRGGEFVALRIGGRLDGDANIALDRISKLSLPSSSKTMVKVRSSASNGKIF